MLPNVALANLGTFPMICHSCESRNPLLPNVAIANLGTFPMICHSCESRNPLLLNRSTSKFDYLLASPVGYWFERQSSHPTRVKQMKDILKEDKGLPVSEIIARGWLNA